MARNELQSILRSAMIDALLALTTPLAGGSSVSDIRFEAPSAHWAAAFVRLPLETVQSEVARRAEQMSRAGVADTVPIALADFDRGPAILTRDQWAIACRVNGSLTPRDLARQAGLPLYDTITALGILLRRGLCTLATPIPPPPRPSTPDRDSSHTQDPHPSASPDRRGNPTPDPRPSVTLIPPPGATTPSPRQAETLASSAHPADPATPPRRGPDPAPRSGSPAIRLPDADRTLARPPSESAPGPADAVARAVAGPGDTPRPPAPRDPSRSDPAASRPAQAGGPASARMPATDRTGTRSGQNVGTYPVPVPAPDSRDFPRQPPGWTSYRPDLEPGGSPGPSARPAGPSAPAAHNFPPPPGPRYPGDVRPAGGARAARGVPSPSWVPSPDELLSQPDTGPQANLAAPRDVPAWDDAPPVRDSGPSRPAPDGARDGLTWGAHRGPAESPPPGPADRPEPPATRSAPTPTPPALKPRPQLTQASLRPGDSPASPRSSLRPRWPRRNWRALRRRSLPR